LPYFIHVPQKMALIVLLV